MITNAGMEYSVEMSKPLKIKRAGRIFSLNFPQCSSGYPLILVFRINRVQVHVKVTFKQPVSDLSSVSCYLQENL